MVQFLGTLRPSPSFSSFATYKRQVYSPITAPKNGFLSFRRMFKAYLQSSSAAADADSGSPSEQSEVIFIGTGTSEGIPRVSCLTNPLKKCEVCLKAAEPGNKNRRLNTSIIVRHHTSSGSSNILVDAGKFFYHSALRWFPAYGIMEFGDTSEGVDSVIPATKLVPSISYVTLFYVASVLFEQMQIADSLIPFQRVELRGRYVTNKEITTFRFWLPTTLYFPVSLLNLLVSIGRKTKLLVGGAFCLREPVFATACLIVPTEAMVHRLVCLLCVEWCSGSNGGGWSRVSAHGPVDGLIWTG